MIKFDDVVLKETDDVSHMVKSLSIIDRDKLGLNDFEVRTDHSTWINLFIISHKSQDVGFIKIQKNIDTRICEINMTYISPEKRKSHIAYKAIICLFYYIFEYLKYEKIESRCFGFNTESFEAQKKYYKLEGELKKHVLHKGEYYSLFLFAFFKEDFYNHKLYEDLKDKIEII